MNEHDEAWQRRLDQGLGEIEGGAPPPDVTARVLARITASERPAGRRGVPARAFGVPRFLVAALLLLGVAVVVGTLWSPRQAEPLPAQDPGNPVWHQVHTLADIAALPEDARHVVGANLGDAELATLCRIAGAGLMGLRLRAAAYVPDGPAARFLSPAALVHLRRMPKLRALHLDWQEELTGADLDVLAELPLLEDLALQRFDTDDAMLGVLERLPLLKSIDLTLNHGFHGDSVARLCNLPRLRRLGLHACSQLSVDMLAPIANATRLQELDLSGIGGVWRGFLVGHATDAAIAQRRGQQDAASAAGAGLDARIVGMLPPSLQRLAIGCSGLDDGMVRALCARLGELRELDLADSAKLTDEGVLAALTLPKLVRLDVSRCPALTADIVEPMARASRLQRVVLVGQAWLTASDVERLIVAGIDIVVSTDSPVAAAVLAARRQHAEALRARASSPP